MYEINFSSKTSASICDETSSVRSELLKKFMVKFGSKSSFCELQLIIRFHDLCGGATFASETNDLVKRIFTKWARTNETQSQNGKRISQKRELWTFMRSVFGENDRQMANHDDLGRNAAFKYLIWFLIWPRENFLLTDLPNYRSSSLGSISRILENEFFLFRRTRSCLPRTMRPRSRRDFGALWEMGNFAN